MPDAGPLPTPSDNQRLTVRFLPAALDVEHEGDVVTLHDSAVRHGGVGSGSLLWFGLGLLAFATFVLVMMVLGAGTSIRLWAQGIAGVVFFAVGGLGFVVLARLPQARSLHVDLRTGNAELRWTDIELVRWAGDVDGLSLLVCPFKAKTILGIGTMAKGFASVAVLEGRRVPPREIAAEHGPLTATILNLGATIGRRALVDSDRGWMVLATGDDPDALEAELRDALPTLTRVIEPRRIDDTLTGPVDAKLLRKPKHRQH
jgi:hypothetical protein